MANKCKESQFQLPVFGSCHEKGGNTTLGIIFLAASILTMIGALIYALSVPMVSVSTPWGSYSTINYVIGIFVGAAVLALIAFLLLRSTKVTPKKKK